MADDCGAAALTAIVAVWDNTGWSIHYAERVEKR
jgi:hypothetical protein